SGRLVPGAGHEGLRASTLMRLHGEAGEVLVQRRLPAIELGAPMSLGQRVLVDRRQQQRLYIAPGLLAAARSFADGLGGFASSSSTRRLSRSDSSMRSDSSTIFSAAGSAMRKMKPVKSSCRRAAARDRSAFSSGLMRSSMRPLSVGVLAIR